MENGSGCTDWFWFYGIQSELEVHVWIEKQEKTLKI